MTAAQFIEHKKLPGTDRYILHIILTTFFEWLARTLPRKFPNTTYFFHILHYTTFIVLSSSLDFFSWLFADVAKYSICIGQEFDTERKSLRGETWTDIICWSNN